MPFAVARATDFFSPRKAGGEENRPKGANGNWSSYKMAELIAQGAEAKLFRDGAKLVKDRISKSYRLPEIDERLRAARTRREAKILEKLQESGFPAPLLQSFSDKSMRIEMDFLQGAKLKDVLHQNPVEFSKEVGMRIGQLHAKDIVHADLTTSNMILSNDKINFIDFGLSFFSKKIEDKAVDLHLFDRALESAHHEIYGQCIDAAILGYKENYSDAANVLSRLEKVQLRGRNKKK